MQFVIITPAKNEGQFIRRTISSVIRQRARPLRFIIVDDGSDDDTAAVVRSFQIEHPWIELVSANSFGAQRSGGAKVVRAFNVGYSHLACSGIDYDFLVKKLQEPPDPEAMKRMKELIERTSPWETK
jgi:glycosyltransferase involved in cell wall biosynthesis